MNWIKSNLGLVVGGGIALVLMGFAGWFLFQQIQADNRASAELDGAISEMNRLVTRDSFPSEDNILAVHKEQDRVQKVLLDPLVQMFPPYPVPDTLDTSGLKELMENAFGRMLHLAKRAGVNVPDEGEGASYSFSFSDVRPKVTFAQETIKPLAFQLLQIESICQVLFDAKVHGLNGVKRPEITEAEDESSADDEEDEDSSASGLGSEYLARLGAAGGGGSIGLGVTDNYIDDVPTTNAITGAVVYPFQVSFQCFSAELSRVLNGLNSARHFFSVKWMAVEQSEAPKSHPDPYAAASQGLYGSGPGGRYGSAGMDPRTAARYGLPAGGGYGRSSINPSLSARYGLPSAGRYSLPSGMAGPSAGYPPEEESSTDLDEKPLTVNMLVDVISIPAPEKGLEDPTGNGDNSGVAAFGRSF